LQRLTPLASASQIPEQQSQFERQISPKVFDGPWLVSTGPDGRQPPIGKQRRNPDSSSVQRPLQHSMSSPVHGSNAGRHQVTFAQAPAVQTKEQHSEPAEHGSPVGRQYGSRAQLWVS
jgi:hypothetical protein